MPVTTLSDITVPYTIMWDDWEVGGTQNSATATLPFKVAFTDHVTFISECMGYPQKVAGVGIVSIPLLYPYASGAYLYAQSFAVKWLGSIGPSGVGDEVQPLSVVVNVGFSTLPYETDTSDGSLAMVSIDVDYGGDFVTNPGSGYKFVTSGAPVDKGVGKFVPQTTYKVTLHNLSIVDESLFEQYLSKVNSDQFTLTVAGITIDRDPGCILFAGANSKRQGTLVEDPKYQLELTFLARPTGYEFNKLFDPTTGEWDFVEVDTGASDASSEDDDVVYSIYEEIEMMGIFDGDEGE